MTGPFGGRVPAREHAPRDLHAGRLESDARYESGASRPLGGAFRGCSAAVIAGRSWYSRQRLIRPSWTRGTAMQVIALLAALCQGAMAAAWDEPFRRWALSILFDGMRLRGNA